jgi:hypothetical protein
VGHRLVALLLLLLAVALGGCVGSTEPATEVGTESARLNARGTADNGPATSYFEYEPTNGAGFRQKTVVRRWPAGASGSFSETVDLLPATPYEFRVCGRDDADSGPYRCAQTRTFTTSNPSGDRVKARFLDAFRPGTPYYDAYKIDARSGPAGENPSGYVAIGPFAQFQGFVNCLTVRGDRAVVGAIGQSDSGDDGQETAEISVDERGKVLAWFTEDPNVLPDCSDISLPPETWHNLREVSVYDAP